MKQIKLKSSGKAEVEGFWRYRSSSLVSLVHFREKDLKNGPRQQALDIGFQAHDLVITVLLICVVDGLQVQFTVEGFHLFNFYIVPKTIIILMTQNSEVIIVITEAKYSPT